VPSDVRHRPAPAPIASAECLKPPAAAAMATGAAAGGRLGEDVLAL
jgi:hypothetical protein